MFFTTLRTTVSPITTMVSFTSVLSLAHWVCNQLNRRLGPTVFGEHRSRTRPQPVRAPPRSHSFHETSPEASHSAIVLSSQCGLTLHLTALNIVSEIYHMSLQICNHGHEFAPNFLVVCCVTSQGVAQHHRHQSATRARFIRVVLLSRNSPSALLRYSAHVAVISCVDSALSFTCRLPMYS